MPTGHYQRKPRVQRISLPCEQCSATITLLPSQLRVRKTVRFCSRTCSGLSIRKPDSVTAVNCDHCDTLFTKRRDHLRSHNYCSPSCASAARAKPDGRWSNRDMIREYNSQYKQRNRSRLIAIAKKWAAANPAKRREIQRRYREKNRDKIAVASAARRARVDAGNFTAEEWAAMKAKYDHKCLCCGRQEPDIKLCIDHIIPLTMDGPHCEANIQPLCKSCNSSKNNRTIDYRSPATAS